MVSSNNDALKTGIVVCFLTIFILNSLSACDMAAFVQSDFAARCQLLLDLCDKAVIARRVGHPDQQKHIGNLSREWVRFFLAHGNAATKPPSLGFIATSSWETGVNEMGLSIATVTRGEVEPANYELLRFKIGLLKDAQKLAAMRSALIAATVSDADAATASSSIKWLEQRFIGPGAVISQSLQQNPYLLARLENSASEHMATAERIDRLAAQEASENDSSEAVMAISENLKEAARTDLRFWQRLFFCD